ncbi:hypothetical protein AAG906_022498 [Vitis piasezkii]
MEVQNVLRISFDGLDEIEQEIFLDVACFFKGWNKNDVVRLVEARKMERLWDPRIFGTEAIEGIFLDMSRSREISFTTEAFKRMERLRLLKVSWSCDFVHYMGKEYQKPILPKDFEFPSHDLRYLHWEGYSLKSLPANFDGQNLIELNLKHSKLKILNLSKSHQLNKIPHFLNMLNLEQLNLELCGSVDKVDSSIDFSEIMEDMECLMKLDLSGTCIKELPSSIEYINHLTSLRMVECENLRSLPSSICRLKSLEELNRVVFSEIMEDMECLMELDLKFSEIMEDMECLVELDLKGTCIKELPSSFEYLNHLTYLSLQYCQNLRSLSSSICRLKSLEYVNLYGYFSEITEDMECLKNLDLSGTGIKELSSSIGYLNHLTSLRLKQNSESDGWSNSKRFMVPILTGRIRSKQNNIRHIPAAITQLRSLEHLNITWELYQIHQVFSGLLSSNGSRKLSESEEVWVVYYPKISIGDQFHSNQYMHLQASFDISILGCSKNIKSCRIHLIYSQDLQHNHISLDDEHNHMPMSLNLLENSGDNRSTAKHEKLREVITNYISITNRSTDQQINNNKTYLKPVSTYKLNHQVH